MNLKRIFLSIALLASVHSIQAATAITAPTVTIPGGSNANAIWRASLSQSYKVFVLVPATATASNVLYRVYPKGKSATSASCLSTDATYPCFEIAINQALNKAKWVQLMLNNDANTAWSFVKTTGYVTVASNKLSVSESLGVAGLRFEPYSSQPVYPTTGYSKIANDGSLLTSATTVGTGAKDWACSRDNVTGLMWEVKTDDNGLRDKDNSYSWYNPDAATNGGFAGYQSNGDGGMGVCTGGILCNTNAYKQALNTQKLCGYSDWRLPTVTELLSLVDTTFSPTINASYFPNTVGSASWASSPYEVGTSDAKVVYFFNGYEGYGNKRNYYSVRLVRGTQ
jgi:hypothetical protein